MQNILSKISSPCFISDTNEQGTGPYHHFHLCTGKRINICRKSIRIQHTPGTQSWPVAKIIEKNQFFLTIHFLNHTALVSTNARK